MNTGLTVLFRALEYATRFVPPPKPPKQDFTPLFQALPKIPQGMQLEVKLSPTATIEAPATSKYEVRQCPKCGHWSFAWDEEKKNWSCLLCHYEQEEAATPTEESVATSCIPCSRSHLSTVSGALNESLRFARGEGIASPEVQRRLMMAEDEINMLERIDMSAESIQRSPEEEQELAREFLPRIRELRQSIGQIASVEQLEKTAADASILGQEFRLRNLQMKGVDLNPVMALAKRVQAGEIDMETARAQLKEMLPEEE